MGFAQESGYTPSSIESLMASVMANVNTQFGTTYTTETFLGTNFYKYFYSLIQRLQQNEVKTSEIFLKLQQYFVITNEKISRPVVTSPGIVEALDAAGYVGSVKPMIDADAGKISICVDVDEDADDYEDVKLAINTLIKNSTVGGVVTQGSEVTPLVLTNGQSFDFKYDLPNRIPVHLRLTITLSENNQVVVGDPDDVKAALLANVMARYRLGRNFEPQRYFSVVDAPWAAVVLLEWSDDDEDNYYTNVNDADFDDLFEVALERIHLVET